MSPHEIWAAVVLLVSSMAIAAAFKLLSTLLTVKSTPAPSEVGRAEFEALLKTLEAHTQRINVLSQDLTLAKQEVGRLKLVGGIRRMVNPPTADHDGMPG